MELSKLGSQQDQMLYRSIHIHIRNGPDLQQGLTKSFLKSDPKQVRMFRIQHVEHESEYRKSLNSLPKSILLLYKSMRRGGINKVKEVKQQSESI